MSLLPMTALVTLLLLAVSPPAAAQAPAMSDAEGIWFVYIHPEQDGDPTWRKRVVRLPDSSVLAFFQRLLRDAPRGDASFEWIQSELGGSVYGLWSLIDARDHGAIAPPTNEVELHRLLHEHLYTEGEVRFDDGVLRVLTDDDEVELVYMFFDDAALERHRDALAFAVHEDPRLPDTPANFASQGLEAPPGLARARPSGDGAGWTVAICDPVFDTAWLTTSFDSRVFEGVRLPQLADWMRRVTPEVVNDGDRPRRWPAPWLLLRAALHDGDDIDGAIARLTPLRSYGLMQVADSISWRASPAEAVHETASAWFDRKLEEFEQTATPEELTVDAGEHHMAVDFGHDFGPMVLFDDVWAAAHPHLARSLMRQAQHWDPLDGLHGRPDPVIHLEELGFSGWHGTWDTFDASISAQPNAICLDGAWLWIAAGSELSRFDLGTGRLSESTDLGAPVAGLSAWDGRLFALEPAPTAAGTWAVREITDGRLGPLHAEVREPEAVLAPARTASGLAVGPDWIAVGLDEHRIVIQPRDGSASRTIELHRHKLSGLSIVEGHLAGLEGTTLVEIAPGIETAKVAVTPLGSTPTALAASDRAFVTIADGRVRRFRRRAPPSLVVRLEPVFDPDVAPAKATAEDLRAFVHRVEGESFTDPNLLESKLRKIAAALATLTTPDGGRPELHAVQLLDDRVFEDRFYPLSETALDAGRSAIRAAGFASDLLREDEIALMPWGSGIAVDPTLVEAADRDPPSGDGKRD